MHINQLNEQDKRDLRDDVATIIRLHRADTADSLCGSGPQYPPMSRLVVELRRGRCSTYCRQLPARQWRIGSVVDLRETLESLGFHVWTEGRVTRIADPFPPEPTTPKPTPQRTGCPTPKARFRLRFSTEWCEWQVRCTEFIGGQWAYNESRSYFADDKDDALATLVRMVEEEDRNHEARQAPPAEEEPVDDRDDVTRMTKLAELRRPTSSQKEQGWWHDCKEVSGPDELFAIAREGTPSQQAWMHALATKLGWDGSGPVAAYFWEWVRSYSRWTSTGCLRLVAQANILYRQSAKKGGAL